ncbi:hypothetical protein SUGI_0978280 [Cryptomeria japonica]|nr:hypothetical protein SUGI_0978280 [Cryptomeria japonica]
MKLIGAQFIRAIIENWFQDNWDHEIALNFLPRGFFTVTLKNTEEREVTNDGPRKMGDAFLFLLRWKSNFNSRETSPLGKKTWFRLYNLPLEYWSFECLTVIGDALGKTFRVLICEMENLYPTHRSNLLRSRIF